MITPFGRFRWLKLPFGLKSSSEIFQRKLMTDLSGLCGVICIADDICVMGDSEADHDANLEALLQRCETIGIKLNNTPDKLQVGTEKINLHGHVFTKQGIQPDPSKLEAISKMPAPTDVHGVRRFCGMVQYLAKFLPELAESADPLRELTHNDSKWSWTNDHQAALDEIKHKVSCAPVLAHYDVNAPLTVQSDASQHGLGVALLQQGKPIAYASRSLTPTERHYAQIEKECLSVVYGLERFDQYTYGRPVIVENDHKPLETMFRKSLCSLPKRLQATMMKIARYDVDLRYQPGHTVILADTLSRAHPPESTAPEYGMFDNISALQFLPISDQRIEEVRLATSEDDVMSQLTAVIVHGWPDNKDLLPDTMRPYYSVRDTLSVYDGIVFKGERIVIPASLRPDIKKHLHMSHLGKDSMLRRARELVYWPGMNQEVEQIAETCDICVSSARKQQKEPMIPHNRGTIPFQKIGVDLFVINGRNYMVTVDYLSNFWEVDYLTTTTTSMIILKLKAHIARYGIPQEIVSDNAQFASREFKHFVDS